MSGKRAHGEGHVEKMKNGKWRGQLMDGYTPEGKRKIVSFKGENKKEVLSKMQDYREQADNHIHLDSGILLSEWADRWYQGYADQVQPSTYCNYKYTLNIIKTFLGNRPLIDILPLDIENFSRAISRKYSSSQVTKCRAMLIQIYDAADANGLIVRNAARLAKLPKNKQEISFGEKEAKKDAFTANEVSLLMENLGNDMLGNSVRVMLGTGIRVQELLALTAEDIAEDGSSIRINKAIKTVDGKSTLGPPKSDRGNRTIPVPSSYRAAAVYLREHGREPFLWTSSWKNPLFSVKTFRNKYYRALKSIPGVRPLSPHCCRHTYVTRLQAGGVPMETIARLVGHSRLQTTDNYLHTDNGTLQSSVAVLDFMKEGDAS